MNTRTHTEPKEAMQPTMYYKVAGVEDYIFVPDFGDRRLGKDTVRIQAAEWAGVPGKMVWFSLPLASLRTFYRPISQLDVPEVWLEAFWKSSELYEEESHEDQVDASEMAFRVLKQSPEPVLRQIITYDPDV